MNSSLIVYLYIEYRFVEGCQWSVPKSHYRVGREGRNIQSSLSELLRRFFLLQQLWSLTSPQIPEQMVRYEGWHAPPWRCLIAAEPAIDCAIVFPMIEESMKEFPTWIFCNNYKGNKTVRFLRVIDFATEYLKQCMFI